MNSRYFPCQAVTAFTAADRPVEAGSAVLGNPLGRAAPVQCSGRVARLEKEAQISENAEVLRRQGYLLPKSRTNWVIVRPEVKLRLARRAGKAKR
jgi:hypothetical protein